MNEQQQSADNQTRRPVVGTVTAILLAVATVLTMWSFSDPHANIPIVSPIVCSIKGGTWYDSSLLIPAGCYARARIGGQSQATPPTTAVPAADPNVSIESEDHASPGDSVACRTWAMGTGEFDEQAYQECMQFGAP